MTDSTPIPRRKLGKTGIEVSALGIGSWGLCTGSYGEVAPETREAVLRHAVERGINVFDASPLWGQAEREIGRLTAEVRDRIVYVTRAGQRPTEHGPLPAFDADALRADCTGSLERLGIERIDVWLLHAPSDLYLRSEAVRRTVEALVTEGKVRHWGAAVQGIDAARAAIEVGAQVLCLPFHMLSPHLVWDLTNEITARGVGLLARSVFCHGMLAGGWPAQKRFPLSDHRNQRWQPEAFEARVATASALRASAGKPGWPATTTSLRFVLAHEVVSSAILGARDVPQLDACLDALQDDAPYMSDEQIARIRAMSFH